MLINRQINADCIILIKSLMFFCGCFKFPQLLYTSVIASEQTISDQEQCDTKTQVIVLHGFLTASPIPQHFLKQYCICLCIAMPLRSLFHYILLFYILLCGSQLPLNQLFCLSFQERKQQENATASVFNSMDFEQKWFGDLLSFRAGNKHQIPP